MNSNSEDEEFYSSPGINIMVADVNPIYEDIITN